MKEAENLALAKNLLKMRHRATQGTLNSVSDFSPESWTEKKKEGSASGALRLVCMHSSLILNTMGLAW